MPINAFCTAAPKLAAEHCDEVYYCGEGECFGSAVIVYEPFSVGTTAKHIYLPSMTDESDLESFCDHIVSTDATALVRASYDLNEAGLIESRYKLSPIMLLHKMGVLDRCTVVGGVCLDNDDLDLMAQDGVSLVVTPTASAGYGHGFAPTCAALRRGIRVGLGTFDGRYNAAHDIKYETEILRLTANAEMRTENAVSDEQLEKLLSFVK